MKKRTGAVGFSIAACVLIVLVMTATVGVTHIPEPTPAPTPVPTPAPTQPYIPTWQKGYADLLRQVPETTDCALLFLDGDEIPELWMNHYGPEHWAMLCTYDKSTGDVIRQPLHAGRCIYAHGTGKLVQIGTRHESGTYQERVTVRNGTIEVRSDEMIKDQETGTETYICEGQEVSYRTFHDRRAECLEGGMEQRPTEYSPQETIDCIIAWNGSVRFIWKELFLEGTRVARDGQVLLVDMDGDGAPEMLNVDYTYASSGIPWVRMYAIEPYTRQIDEVHFCAEEVLYNAEERLVYLTDCAYGRKNVREYVYRLEPQGFVTVWEGRYVEEETGEIRYEVGGVEVTETVYRAMAAAAFPVTTVENAMADLEKE